MVIGMRGHGFLLFRRERIFASLSHRRLGLMPLRVIAVHGASGIELRGNKIKWAYRCADIDD